MISSQSISIFLIATEFYFKICMQLTTKKLTSKKQETGLFLSDFCLARKSKTFPSLVNLNSYNFFNFLGSASKPERSALCTASSDNLIDFLHAGARIWTWVNHVLSINATQYNTVKHVGIASTVLLPFPAQRSIGASKTRISQSVAGAQRLYNQVS